MSKIGESEIDPQQSERFVERATTEIYLDSYYTGKHAHQIRSCWAAWIYIVQKKMRPPRTAILDLGKDWFSLSPLPSSQSRRDSNLTSSSVQTCDCGRVHERHPYPHRNPPTLNYSPRSCILVKVFTTSKLSTHCKNFAVVDIFNTTETHI